LGQGGEQSKEITNGIFGTGFKPKREVLEAEKTKKGHEKTCFWGEDEALEKSQEPK